MANLDETGTLPGNPDRNGEPHDAPAADGPSRLQELERENARLRAELAGLRLKHQINEDVIAAMVRRRLPATEEEFLNPPVGPSISDLIREFDRESGAIS